MTSTAKVRGVAAIDEQLGKKIKRAREAKGWTQEDLARRCNAHQSTVGHWERGTVPKNKLGFLIQLLGLRLDDDGDSTPEPLPNGLFDRLRSAGTEEIFAEIGLMLAELARRMASPNPSGLMRSGTTPPHLHVDGQVDASRAAGS